MAPLKGIDSFNDNFWDAPYQSSTDAPAEIRGRIVIQDLPPTNISGLEWVSLMGLKVLHQFSWL